MRRLHGLVPGAYSRLGAAIRHGAAVLEERGGTPRRLLVVLSDGLAYDHGYEPAYGAADARRALAEARRRGTGCLCLSIGASTDAETLRRVFGSAAHATLPGSRAAEPGDRSAVPLGPSLRGGPAAGMKLPLRSRPAQLTAATPGSRLEQIFGQPVERGAGGDVACGAMVPGRLAWTA